MPKVPKFNFEAYPPAKPAKVANLHPGEAPQSGPREHVLTCADCPHFEANQGPNPREGWGRCLKRNKGRFGCATACEAALSKIQKEFIN